MELTAETKAPTKKAPAKAAIDSCEHKFETKTMPINMHVLERVELHQAVTIDGRTEKSLSNIRIPTIKALYWTEGYAAVVIVAANKTHVLPAAAVSNSILEK